MPDISADAKARVPILDERKDVVGIPKFVIRMRSALGMTMNTRRNVVFLDELLDQINLIRGRFNGDGMHSELLGELKTTRKDLAMVVNGLVMSGDLVRSSEARALPSEVDERIDPEQALLLSALALRCAEALSDAIDTRLEARGA